MGDHRGAPVPGRRTTVQRHSAAYFKGLLTTDVLVANDIISKHLVKGPRVHYVQMWHGTPLKLLGHDERAHSYTGAEAHLKRMARDVAKWDYLVSPSPACTEMFRSAFGFGGEVWETGYPRNDVLRAPGAEAGATRSAACSASPRVRSPCCTPPRGVTTTRPTRDGSASRCCSTRR